MASSLAPGSAVVYSPNPTGSAPAAAQRALAVVVAGPFQDGTFDLDVARGVGADVLRPLVGEAVEYHSASMQAWIPGRVVKPGAAAGTLDLDCKEAADIRRVRLPQASEALPAGVPQSPGGGGRAGPLALQPGDHCFYRSATHGWLATQVLRYSAEDQTYDLRVKPRVCPENIFCVKEGSVVEYHSASLNGWIPARVVRLGLSAETFDLDCKEMVHITKIRPAEDAPLGRGHCPVSPPPAAEQPQGWGSVPLEKSEQPPPTPPPLMPTSEKLSRIQEAVRNEDQHALREALESQSAIKLVGDELDKASHKLWALEARPGAIAELHRAMKARDKRALEAAIEAAAVCQVAPDELEAASAVLQDMRAPLWRYQAQDGKHADIRVNPDIDGPRTRCRLNSGDVFCVSEERQGQGEVVYLRLADGRGWMFDQKPGFGVMCTRFQQSGRRDRCGAYVVIHDQAALTENAPVGQGDSLIGRVRCSTRVEVLELRPCKVMGRDVLRGRLQDPAGWVTILDYESGERWAVTA